VRGNYNNGPITSAGKYQFKVEKVNHPDVPQTCTAVPTPCSGADCASRVKCTTICLPATAAISANKVAAAKLTTATQVFDTDVKLYEQLRDERDRVSKACEAAENACKAVGTRQGVSTVEQPPSKSFIQKAEFGCYVNGPATRGGQNEVLAEKKAQYALKDLPFDKIQNILNAIPPSGSAISAPALNTRLAEFEQDISFLTAIGDTGSAHGTTATLAETQTGTVTDPQGYGCEPLCEPKAACAEVFLQGPQLVVQVHYGLTMDCHEKITAAEAQVMRVAYKAPGAYNSLLSPFAGVALFGGKDSCNGAKAAFNLNNPAGAEFQQVSQNLIRQLAQSAQNAPASEEQSNTDAQNTQAQPITIVINANGVVTSNVQAASGKPIQLQVQRQTGSTPSSGYLCTFKVVDAQQNVLTQTPVPLGGATIQLTQQQADSLTYFCSEKASTTGILTIS
ncbi:MAG: hypothetical protein Q8P02_00395, partial [Candidatus Micrarchaeota archaeon]|nr:hypothetical protein [Candidatus Micrarchaeota archaeon]